MVFCGLLQLPVPSYKSVRATGRGCYCLVPVHSRVKNNTHIWCLRMEEFSVKCWCGEHFDLGFCQPQPCCQDLSRKLRIPGVLAVEQDSPVELMGHKARLVQYKLYGTFPLLASVRS